MLSRRAKLQIRVAAIAMVPMIAWGMPGPASAQGQRTTVPAMPLEDTLARIHQQTGVTINADPDAVRGLSARSVKGARDAMAAVRQATRGLRLAVSHERDGSILVVNDIIVIAHRDEAETNVTVRGATSSTRTGETLRDQPRNVQVLSAKLLAEQQAQSLPDALRNAGGVTVNAATVQGGVGYTVRGLSSGGAVNGLPTPSNSSFAAGSTQPIANVERLEVLKGPDAILLGGDSLGGTVNIVTKKPSADERLYVSSEVGSFGSVRGTVDANRSISADDSVSARIIATAATADHNFGGYRGNEDYLFAPSIRYKKGGTDIIASITTGNQIFGMVPYTLYDTTTKRPVPIRAGVPLIGGQNQYSQIKSTIYDAQVNQAVGSWLTIVGHWQHQNTDLFISQYSPFVVLAPNLVLVSTSGVKQHATNNAVDGYARIAVKTGPVEHKLIAGAMATNFKTSADDTGSGDMFPYDYVAGDPPLPPLPRDYFTTSTGTGKQTSYYAQYLVKYWKFALLASVRKTSSDAISSFRDGPTARYTSNGAVTPSYGAVVAVTDNVSVYGQLAFGFIASFQYDRRRNLLPDTRTRNAETGIKLDLLDKRVLLNASWFRLSQSNYKVPDPLDRLYYINLPAQLAEGVDVSVSGEPLKGLMVSGAFTRTRYSMLTSGNADVGSTVVLQPRDQYSAYASYRHRVADDVTAGLGAGIYGRSSAAIDRAGQYWVGPSVQTDLNGFLTIGKLDLNLGVRNLFDRRNYGPTITTSYVPLGEPRTWRLTVGYRFR
ncbi:MULTISPECIES: TonB-dependent receptor [unclassified Sphingomonas]|uniref:TonB-dependent siderophore receptor n=1 Tax=unclassified Sphingomonas TaxID=196159 RepID=UPI0028637884|nr:MULTISPECIES: TonB-dependent receptor [unclassified Sphingomonas]MDR6116200.1 iron complex outermembrane receptor protein [Sphingomonas sp. SORGH_AS_0789]MDR6150125.1 iron complex outermembrane receptor protein [Sphingomonas sp. SORGH_AS_0742]